jgi:hypothetical protein
LREKRNLGVGREIFKKYYTELGCKLKNMGHAAHNSALFD